MGILSVFLIAVGIGAMVLFQRAATGLEQPAYTVEQSSGQIEIRRYQATPAAEVTVEGSRSAATRKAFGILFDYISGANQGNGKIAMTAPVRQAPDPQKISMTAPVTQAPAGADAWQVAFFLPSQYTVASAPKPDNEQVRIVSVPGGRVAAITFSGRWTDRNFEKHAAQLSTFIGMNGLTATGAPVYAYFNDPFTLPPFRRNEVQIPIAP
ncbi:SOUL heme-binding protein [Roseibium hamelinense]|uniref:SOUL heme-binding protein n=1 Tax=Roseibium hamelinense TaxID=150831 RepID=A0A562T0S1_9HYPH|nr:heme-binding protein [Roseibium hamelinense]TWI87175.1 SOUL heme-binding protein [Roseibium hamelinense]